MKQIVPNKQAIINEYAKIPSYTLVGQKFGISRQRVHQIVTGHKGSPFAHNNRQGLFFHKNSKFKTLTLLKQKPCQLCKSPSQILRRIDGNPKNNAVKNFVQLCQACHNLLLKGRKHKVYTPFRGVVCKGWCGRKLFTETRHGGEGYCRSCYQAKKAGRIYKPRPKRPDNCLDCFILLTDKNYDCTGRCKKCYAKIIYRKNINYHREYWRNYHKDKSTSI